MPAGEIPKDVVGINDSHFTVAPFNGLTCTLRVFVVIFKEKKFHPIWALGVNVFMEWDDQGDFENFGPGKRHPGLALRGSGGKEIPVLFEASEKASMNAEILEDAFRMMDKKCITTWR